MPVSMRTNIVSLSAFLFLLSGVVGCVDPYEPDLRSSLNVVVVEGTVNNLPEAQIIRLSRSFSDPLTGRPGYLPLTKAQVEVLVDSVQVVAAHETEDGRYQLPADFRGQIGRTYQLRFTLSDGTRYQSTQQVMPAAPPISKVTARFNPVSFPAYRYDGISNAHRGAHEISIDVQDPAGQRNYYRWDWILYEQKDWCRTCERGVYAVNAVLPNVYRGGAFVSGNVPYEDCFTPDPKAFNGQGVPYVPDSYWAYDYECRTACWEIIRSRTVKLFDDQFTNGGLIANRPVAQIPYYTYRPCLVEIRQTSLTAEAYRYVRLLQEQVENNGGIADTPPTVLVGNVHNRANGRENVVGYFTASGVTSIQYWLDRRDATGTPVGAYDDEGNPLPGESILFYVVNRRLPRREPSPPYTGMREAPAVLIFGGPSRPPTALCPSDNHSTPVKPAGWRE